MKASQLIEELKKAINKHGDIKVYSIAGGVRLDVVGVSVTEHLTSNKTMIYIDQEIVL